MNYNDIVTKVLDYIGLLNYNLHNLIKSFNKYLKKYTPKDLQTKVSHISKGIDNVEKSPSGHFAVKRVPIKFTFIDSIDASLFEDVAKIPVYLRNYSHLDLTQGYFTVLRKTDASWLLAGILGKQPQRNNKDLNKFIETRDVIDNLFKVEQIDYQTFKAMPDCVKLKEI